MVPRPDGREPWQGSTRRGRLPADWDWRREQVIFRDHGVCQWPVAAGATCGEAGNQVDHIQHGDDHQLDNLWLLCEPHHASKSAHEGAQVFTPLRRPPEQHPALS